MRLDLVMSPRRIIVPVTRDDQELLRQVRAGDLLPVTIRKARNGDHHRKLWALLAFVSDNHPGWPDQNTGEIIAWTGAESVATFLKIRTKHFRGMQVYRDSVFVELRSISYRELDEAEFDAWADRAREVIFTELFPGLRERERIEAEIDRWLQWN